MRLPLYQIDAFAKVPFEGNPAAVCPLQSWLDDALMQKIAMENNLAETVFFVREGEGYRIRWFTPECEVDLCGHATLAAAHVLWHYLDEPGDMIRFESLSGALAVARRGNLLELDFPARPISDPVSDLQLLEALGLNEALWVGIAGERALVEVTDEQALATLSPDLRALARMHQKVFYITARSERCDFVCRVFAPAKGIDEDPVTGSAYTALGPYWGEKLGKETLHARQVSKRGGDVQVTLAGERVLIAGQAVCVLQGELLLPETD